MKDLPHREHIAVGGGSGDLAGIKEAAATEGHAGQQCLAVQRPRLQWQQQQQQVHQSLQDRIRQQCIEQPRLHRLQSIIT
jgi:hypothetical protein